MRAHLRERSAIAPDAATALEQRLRAQIAALVGGGLAHDEAFLVAVKRIGAVDHPTRRFAREHAGRLWKQLVLSGGCPEVASRYGPRSFWVAFALAVAAGAAIKAPALFDIPRADAFYARNFPFLTLPFIVAYFAWQRPLSGSTLLSLGAVFGAAAMAVNVYPFSPDADTLTLTAMHMPIALWLAVGVAYVGGRWRGSERRMDFVRFTGELFIYYVLIALGGAVLIGLTGALFAAIGIPIQTFVADWIIPTGAAGAIVIATWLVEAKQGVLESIAPVLTRVFSPLFALAFVAFMLTMLVTGRGIGPEREVLLAFDLLLVVVFGLLLYSISARDAATPPGLLDWIQVILVAAALIVDVLALWAIGSRITDFGFTPNRVAALGENLVLFANLASSLLLYLAFLSGRVTFTRLAAWQTAYLYVLAGWAAIVAFLFPPVFGFR